MTLKLPRKNDRGPRVAMLVFNDCQNDSRVLKEAASVRDAGGSVRIFGVARHAAGFVEGSQEILPEVLLTRCTELDTARHLPWLVSLGRKIKGPDAPPRDALAIPRDGHGTPVILRGGHAQPDASVILRGGHSPESQDPATHPMDSATTRGMTGASIPGMTEPDSPGLTGARIPGMTAGTAAAAAARGLPAKLATIAGELYSRTFAALRLSVYWADAVRHAVAWRPDIVHANDGNTLAPAMAISLLTGAHVVYDAHELWTHRNVRRDRPVAPLVEAVLERAGVACASGVVTVSPSIVTWMKDHFSLAAPPALVRNVPASADPPAADAVDPAHAGASPANPGRLRELAGLSASDRVIAYAGRITTSRGIEETLDALALLPENTHLVMLGYGDPLYIATLWARAERLGVAHRVHQVGPVAPHEVSSALADGDVSIVHVRPTCLSYRYSLPNKLFESIHAGLPVVAANLPDIREIVESVGIGAVFEHDTPEEMAATITRVLERRDEYRASVAAARPHFAWEHEADRLIGLYRRILLGDRA